MAWIELHDTLPDHDKVMSVSEALNLDKDTVVGKLVRLWTWALNHREDGFFKLRDADIIVEVMRYKGKPQRLVDALVSSHLLDKTDDGYAIHDWEERVGMLLAKREKKRSQDRDRKRRQRSRDSDSDVTQCHGDVTRDISENVTQCHAATVPKPKPNTVPLRESPPKSPQGESPPTLKEVTEYVRGNGYCMDPQLFHDYYAARSWTIGGVVMQDWKAAVRSWERREKEYRKDNPALNYSQRKYTEEDVARMGILSFDDDEEEA